jgi:uroporphyrinogen decarboxylase
MGSREADGNAMTPRERVMAALGHQAPDRVPRDLGGTTASGISLVAYKRLVQYLQIDQEAVLSSRRGRIVRIPESILARFAVDTRGVIPDGAHDLGIQNPDGTFTDSYGVVRRLPNEEANWYVVHSPLSGAISRHDIDNAARTWGTSSDLSPPDGLDATLSKLHTNTDYAVVLNLPLGPIQTVHAIRGFGDWLVDVASDPRLVSHLLWTFLDIWLEKVRHIMESACDNVDVLFYADDVAIHTGPMISPRSYEQLLLPIQKRLVQTLREWSSAKILYHCCGSVIWLMDKLIDMGIDAVNPLQVNSLGMQDTHSIKQRYGNQLAFWGGVDTSQILPRGTPEDVRGEVRRRIDDLAGGGGYVLAAVHNIQGDVPPENLCAMWEIASQR